MANKNNSSKGKAPQSGGGECCMCGDYGLSIQLFRCKVCHFRSQHRYCSNLYPRADSYRVCNWCLLLHQNDDNNNDDPVDIQNQQRDSMNQKSIPDGAPVKKPPQMRAKSQLAASEERSTAARKRISIANSKDRDMEEEKVIRRTKSEEMMTNNGGRNGGSSSSSGKGACRNKARRYKLLDEVSA